MLAILSFVILISRPVMDCNSISSVRKFGIDSDNKIIYVY